MVVGKRSTGVGLAVVALLAAGAAAAQGPVPDFAPDYTFRGSALTGWRPLGQADWRAESGEIVGKPRSAEGGWLLLDRQIQDVGFFSRFRCAAPCRAGVLLRAEKTPTGMSGIFLSLADGDLLPYRVTLDANGHELTRERLGRAAGSRWSPPPAPPAAPPAGAQPTAAPAGGGGPTVPPANVKLPGLQPPAPGIWPGQWNAISVLVDANIVRPTLNGGIQIPMAYSGDLAKGYGAIALYVGGGSEVRFKDVSYKDIGLRKVEPEKVSTRFRMQRLEEFSYAWDTAIADINRDGKLDVVAGPYYYLGPDYTERREIYLGQSFSPGVDYAANMTTYAYDFTGDGWPDVLAGAYGNDRPMVLYVNPKGENRRWDKQQVLPGLSNEFTLMADVDGDNKPDVIYITGGRVVYATFQAASPFPTWTVHPVSETGLSYQHSFGVGDVNGDGRSDILQSDGWWEQPAGGAASGAAWAYHPEEFARWSRSQVAGGGNIAVWDVNGDKLNDVVTSLNAHGWGLAWYEQKRDAGGRISFVQHMIMDDFSTKNAGGVTFSELHSGVMPADFDGDGLTDFVTGKRFWSHLDTYTDPDAQSSAVLYLYRAVRNRDAPGGIEFVPELIHNRSGVGSGFKVADLNQDGAPDIITAVNRGTFIFWNTMKK
jgi:hypothetical protein